MRVKTYSYHDIKTGRRFEGTISEAVEYLDVCKSSLEKWEKFGDCQLTEYEIKQDFDLAFRWAKEVEE